MTMDFHRSRSQPRNRFGQLSKSMFFARHVAQPRYLKFITGAVGQRVCHVREVPIDIPTQVSPDVTTSLMSDPRFGIEFSPDSYNETLRRSYASRLQPRQRRERLLPPIPGWNPSGMVVEDTDNWRRELSRIAEMVGLVTPDELVDVQSRRETPTTSLPLISSTPTPKSPITTGQYSRQSGRWNETPKSVHRCRSARGRTPLKSSVPENIFCVDEQEREMWMLQVLCQILQTENINEIQSWLVSSGPNEKEAVRQLITKAIKGLEENGRIQSNDYSGENAKGIQVNMDSFGSLLANRYPNVSSSIPITPLREHRSRSKSRPRTAPAMPLHMQTQTEFQSKSAGVLQSLNENTETDLNTTSNMTQPTTTDLKRDVQILVLDDNDNQNQQAKHDETPF